MNADKLFYATRMQQTAQKNTIVCFIEIFINTWRFISKSSASDRAPSLLPTTPPPPRLQPPCEDSKACDIINGES